MKTVTKPESALEFHVVDVFSTQPLRGNPVLVVLAPSERLDAPRMQAFAAWNGMPETVYLQPLPGWRSGYAARIFSARTELAFAGHPSLGAAHVALETGLVSRPLLAGEEADVFGSGLLASTPIWQHCAAGEVELRLAWGASGAYQVFVKTPVSGQLQALDEPEAQCAARAIGALRAMPAFRVDAGARWIVAFLEEPGALHSLRPDLAAIEALSLRQGVCGITVYAPAFDSDARFDVRSFGPAIGVPEDSACGGGNACVAVLQHHLERGAKGTRDAPCAAYDTRQGRHVGRDARIRIAGPVPQGRFWIGGATRTLMKGRVEL